jgi:PAS domain S-box-containing protein/putative nucleotidyltransferase with HDIG domain
MKKPGNLVKKPNESLTNDFEVRYRHLLDAAREGILILEAKTGIITDVNSYLLEMLGFSRTEFIDKRLMEVTAFRDNVRIQEIFDQQQENEYVSHENISIQDRAGQTIPVEIFGSVYQLGNEKVFQWAIRDITEHKQVEESLQLQSAALNAAASAIMITTPDGSIEWVNQAFTKLTGYSSKDSLGKNPRDLVKSGRQDQAFYKNLWDTIQSGEVWKSELVNHRQDGSLYIEEETINPVINSDGKISHFIAIKQDITARKKAEERIQRQLEHLTALSAIDRIIASNFDLKNSLSEILTHVTIELGVEAADIFVLNPNSQILEFGAGHGFHTTAVQDAQIRVGERYAGRAALERQSVEIQDLNSSTNQFSLPPYWAGEGFVSYFCEPLISKGQVKGVLEVFNRKLFDPDLEWCDFLKALAGQTALAIENASLFDSLQRSNSELTLAYNATIEGWSYALDLRDRETEGHTQRVTEMAVKLARCFSFSEADLVQIRWGALLHDIGKMGIPDEILHKPAPLTEEEIEKMKKHPTYAYEMLSPIRYLRLALDIPYCHHEKWDGSGYPRGLKGTQIPLAARIFAVVDVWDALNTDRPYRLAWTEETIREHIRGLSGTHFDPQVVDMFLKIP